MRAASLLFVVACAGCYARELPPPPAPARATPAVDVPERAPARGSGRVVLEADGETADVLDENAHVVCTTPCVIDLAYGTHPLVFVSTNDRTRTSDVDIEVGEDAKVVRHRMGERHDGGALRSLGFAVLVLGAVTAVAGASAWATDASEHAPLVTGLGAGLAGLALPVLYFDRPSERPGSTTEFYFDQASMRSVTASTVKPNF